MTAITKVALDDRNILCFEFDDDEWVAVNQHKWATEEQRRLIEEHPEFEGWDDDDLCDSEDEEVVCPKCGRTAEECEKNTESEKNPITEWCGWGLSCDDCYYKDHPDEDEDEDEDEA